IARLNLVQTAGALTGPRPAPWRCAVDLIDRAAARLEADEQDRNKCQDIPGGEVVHGRDQRVCGCLRVDEVRRPGDHRQPGRTDDLISVVPRRWPQFFLKCRAPSSADRSRGEAGSEAPPNWWTPLLSSGGGR